MKSEFGELKEELLTVRRELGEKIAALESNSENTQQELQTTKKGSYVIQKRNYKKLK